MAEIATLNKFDPVDRIAMIWFDLSGSPKDEELVNRHSGKHTQVLKLEHEGAMYSLIVEPRPWQGQVQPKKLLIHYKIQAMAKD